MASPLRPRSWPEVDCPAERPPSPSGWFDHGLADAATCASAATKRATTSDLAWTRADATSSDHALRHSSPRTLHTMTESPDTSRAVSVPKRTPLTTEDYQQYLLHGEDPHIPGCEFSAHEYATHCASGGLRMDNQARYADRREGPHRHNAHTFSVCRVACESAGPQLRVHTAGESGGTDRGDHRHSLRNPGRGTIP